MKIKIYELLGMIKDDKTPKNARIRYFDRHNDYYDECNLKENEIINRLYYGNIELNEEVEIIDDEEKKLHANNIEFNIYDDKKEFIITLDENDLGIDKLHLDNCYFYKENDKWYIKHINLKPIAYISQEHKIPEKLNISNFPRHNNSLKKTAIKINEIIDYLEVNNGIMDKKSR